MASQNREGDDEESYLLGNPLAKAKATTTKYDDQDGEGAPPPPPRTPLEKSFASSHPPGGAFEQGSLDFERVINEYSIQANRDRYLEYQEDRNDDQGIQWKRKQKEHLFGYTGRKATRWALSVLAGLLTGSLTVLVVSVTETFVDWRSRRLDEKIIDADETNTMHISAVFWQYSITCVVLAILSSLLCVGWIPQAAGSGIPEVKAYLNGVRVRKFNSLPLLLVKIVGTILSVSSSLALGMEGPLVHIGAIVGACCSNLSGILTKVLTANIIPTRWTQKSQSRQQNTSLLHLHPWFRKLWLWNSSDLAHFANDGERRDLISIGAAVGFAASFGAPIGGLLFVLDDVSSYFAKNMFLRVLVANALGTFCLAWYRNDLSNYSVINLGNYYEEEFDIFVNRFEEIPLYVFIGALGGMMGGLFCLVLDALNSRTKRIVRGKLSQLLQIIVLSFATSFVLFYLPHTMKWTCRFNGGDDSIEEGRRFFCEEGEVNELATILFGSRTTAIRRILTDPTQFQARTLLIVGVVFYLLMLVTISSMLPTGVFTPTVLCGASLGGCFGLIFQEYVDSDITPSTFALLGVAAILTGIQRSTVSICVILVEGTGQIKVLIPVIVTVIVSRYVAHLVHPEGVYELFMRLKGYPYLDHEEKKRYDMFEVKDIMNTPAVIVRPREKASRLVKLLKESNHHGFPVVEKGSGKFLGLVRRNQIVALLECGVFDTGSADSSTKRSESFTGSSGELSSPSSTPYRGVGKEPLMYFAYHIKDDRYDYLQNQEKPNTNVNLKDDEFEKNSFLLSIHGAGDVVKDLTFSNTPRSGSVSLVGDDSLPLLSSVRKSFDQLDTSKLSERDHLAPQGFARVGEDEKGNVVITAFNRDFRDHYVNLAAVMNKGTYCVTEDFPVSKAHLLFTKLGLRWIVVLGGFSGGEGKLTFARCFYGTFVRRNLRSKFLF